MIKTLKIQKNGKIIVKKSVFAMEKVKTLILELLDQ